MLIQSNDENKTYAVQGQAVSLVSKNSAMPGLVSMDILNGKNLSDLRARPFNNVTDMTGDDLLGLKTVNNQTFFTLLKDEGDGYKQEAWAKIGLKSPMIINLSKVDIDQDGRVEYVIAAIDSQDEKRITHFYVFDSKFEPSHIKIGARWSL